MIAQWVLKITFALLSFGCIPAATAGPHADAASPLQFQDGRMSISGGPHSPSELIKIISAAAGFEVVRVGSLPDEEPIICDFQRRKPEDIVRSLLIGHSYAIIYSGRGGLKKLALPEKSLAEPPAAAADSHPTPKPVLPEGFSETAAPRERRIRSQIALLKSRLASGRSGQSFETWTSVRDPRYVVHEEELLEHMEKELRELEPSE